MNGAAIIDREDVPRLAKPRIETVAQRLLHEYEQHRGAVAPPIPIDEIVELHLGLTIEFMDMRQLFGAGDVHGALWVRRKRIGVDRSLDPAESPSKTGRYRFTLAHEAGHWRLHRRRFLGRAPDVSAARGFSGPASYLSRSGEARMSIEWQANYFAACLLMPRHLIMAAWEEHFGAPRPVTLNLLRERLPGARTIEAISTYNGDPDRFPDLMFESVSRPLAALFEVSSQAMRIRLGRAC